MGVVWPLLTHGGLQPSDPSSPAVLPSGHAGHPVYAAGVTTRTPSDTNNSQISKVIFVSRMMPVGVFVGTKRRAQHRSGEPFSSVSPTSTAYRTNGNIWMEPMSMSNASESSLSVRIMRAFVAAISQASLLSVLILVLETYGYSPEDITVLKDSPELPSFSQPSRDNMVIEPYSPFCARLVLTHTPAS